jgi:hypothetical protein
METTIPLCSRRSKTAAASIGSPSRSPQPAMPVWEVRMAPVDLAVTNTTVSAGDGRGGPATGHFCASRSE